MGGFASSSEGRSSVWWDIIGGLIRDLRRMEYIISSGINVQ
jgi:hypothetical protein